MYHPSRHDRTSAAFLIQPSLIPSEKAGNKSQQKQCGDASGDNSKRDAVHQTEQQCLNSISDRKALYVLYAFQNESSNSSSSDNAVRRNA